MVGRIAACARVERNFLWGIGAFEGIVDVIAGPVAVGQDSVSLYMGLRRDKHMVDAAVGKQFRLEVVERAVLRKADTGSLITVLQQPRLRENRINFIRLSFSSPDFVKIE